MAKRMSGATIGLIFFGGGVLWLIACLFIRLTGSWRDPMFTSTGGVVLVIIGVTVLIITALRRRSTHGDKSSEEVDRAGDDAVLLQGAELLDEHFLGHGRDGALQL
jgi:hypothetical protein